jgi:hypothetical protein
LWTFVQNSKSQNPCGYLSCENVRFFIDALALFHSPKLLQNLLVSLAIHDSNHPKAKGDKKRGLNNMLFLQQVSELSHIRLMVCKSRPQESEQDDKWSFCLTAGTLCPANQERQ